MNPSKRFWLLLKPDKKEVRNIYAYAISSGVISLSLPLGIQAIVNLIQIGQINASWVVLVVIVVLGILISGILQVYQLRITENLQQKIFTRAAFEFSYRIPRIRMEALYNRYAPELMNRFFDIASVQKGLSKILIDVSSAIFIVVFSLILLSFYHPFFILFSVMLLLLVYSIFRFTAKKGMKTSLQESEFKYKVAHWLEELSRTSTSFKLAGNNELPMHRTDKSVEKYLTARESHFRILVKQYAMMIGFKVIIATGLLAIGGLLVMNQQMNIGQFIAAEIIILVVLNSVEKLILSIDSVYDILTSLEKIAQVTDLELDREDGIKIPISADDKGMDIELKNVSFSYPKENSKTLENISFSLEKGERMVITGKSGSGKSTLLHIISSLYQTDEGLLTYNGFTVGNLSLDSIREAIGEDITMDRLFEGSIIENITLGRENVSFEDVKWTIDNLGLADFIKNLPEGYNTILKTQGRGLPESIVRKLLLARCIANKPKLLLLEDVLDHLDNSTCKKIVDFITDKQHNWTIIAVSTNSYLAKSFNKVIVLEDGKITHSGSYEEMKNIANFKITDYA